MFEGDVATVKISGHTVEVEVDIISRWYVPGRDTWKRVKGGPTSFPQEGEWQLGKQSPPGIDLNMYIWIFGSPKRESSSEIDLEMDTDVEDTPTKKPPFGHWERAADLWAFDKFDRLKKGLAGKGVFWAKGYVIPPSTGIDWRVLSIT